ncbi:MAG: HAD family hydrolase [Bacteroidota bacterium]
MKKPDPRLFMMALARGGACPGDAVVIGDSWAFDVLGARAAGIRSLWLNRGRAACLEAGLTTEIAGFEPLGQVVLNRPVERWLKLSALALFVTGVLSNVLRFFSDASRARTIQSTPLYSALYDSRLLPAFVERFASLADLGMKALAFYGFGCIIGLVKERRPDGTRTFSTDNITVIGLAALASAVMVFGLSSYLTASSLGIQWLSPFDDAWLSLATQAASMLSGAMHGISFGLTLVGVAQVAGRLIRATSAGAYDETFEVTMDDSE